MKKTEDPGSRTLDRSDGVPPGTSVPSSAVRDPRSKIQDLSSRLRHDESGLTALEKLGIVAAVVVFLSFIPAARGLFGDFYDAVFKQTNDAGETSSFSVAARGILITVVAIVAFLGSAALVLYTNLGKRLAFLVAGAATTGWLVINGILFIVYAPRGLRPRTVEGLNLFQQRVPAIAMTLGALVLFLMFVVALDKYEKESEES